jgi:hypothetical protein
LDTDAIKRKLTGKQPDYIRGFLDALRALGHLDERDAGNILAWATEAAMRRVISGPVADPTSSAES